MHFHTQKESLQHTNVLILMMFNFLFNMNFTPFIGSWNKVTDTLK